MPNIVHRIGIESSSPEGAYNALATTEGLASWWTETVLGESRVGGTPRLAVHRGYSARQAS